MRPRPSRATHALIALRSFTLLSAVLVAAGCTTQRYAPDHATHTPVPVSDDVTANAPAPSGGPSADDHMAHMSAADLAAPTIASGAVRGGFFQDAKLPASNAGAAERLKASPRHSEWVKFPSAPGSTDSVMAFVVYPFSKTASQKAPVVVVVHEVFGLSSWVRGVADQVAADGFIAVAPDFLSRVRPGGPSSVELNSDTARALIQRVNYEERVRIVSAAANYGMMLPSATQRYAVIGYCWGGTTSWAHAVNGGVKGFSGAVPFYGAPYTTGGRPATATEPAVPASVDADSLKKITKPVLMLNGSGDARIGAMMPAIDSIMKANKKNYEGHNYPGAIHGFLRAQGDPRATNRNEAEEAANIAATKDGWPRTVTFLKKQLGVK
ncbi:MAG: dienelactone hydrolase family protein [Gemmatimonadaceae bacterium]|nr:dienelactone hydrolase family protein [Gemmatimonadaceae bacterium]